MKTSVIDVRDMLSVLSVAGVEGRIGKVPGVESVTVNFAAGSATVRYDETRLDVAEIKSAVRQSGYASEDESGSEHARGQQSAHNPAMNLPEPAPASSAHLAAVPEAPEIAPAAPLAPAAPIPAIAAPATSVAAKDKAQPGPGLQPSAPVVVLTRAPSSTLAPTAPLPAPVAPAEMAREMGHGGKDQPAMLCDMRNRFWICLIFTVPIVVYAPIADLFKPPAPPFGLKLNLWLFFLASAAILYPGWPFVVSAWRALRTRTFSMAVLVVLSVGTGYLFSVGSTFCFKGGRQFFEAASVLLALILLGHWLKIRARARASESSPIKQTVLK